MNEELIIKSDVVKIVKLVLSPASSLVNVARARRQMLTEINELESKPEIVKCKDCKYHHRRICPIERYFSLDGFCSRGER